MYTYTFITAIENGKDSINAIVLGRFSETTKKINHNLDTPFFILQQMKNMKMYNGTF